MPTLAQEAAHLGQKEATAGKTKSRKEEDARCTAGWKAASLEAFVVNTFTGSTIPYPGAPPRSLGAEGGGKMGGDAGGALSDFSPRRGLKDCLPLGEPTRFSFCGPLRLGRRRRGARQHRVGPEG